MPKCPTTFQLFTVRMAFVSWQETFGRIRGLETLTFKAEKVWLDAAWCENHARFDFCGGIKQHTKFAMESSKHLPLKPNIGKSIFGLRGCNRIFQRYLQISPWQWCSSMPARYCAYQEWKWKRRFLSGLCQRRFKRWRTWWKFRLGYSFLCLIRIWPVIDPESSSSI